MNRNGSALLTVLWLTVLLGSISASAVGIARLGAATTANRLALTRGKWAAEGCLALAQARFAETRLVSDLARTSLGAGIHVGARLATAAAMGGAGGGATAGAGAVDANKLHHIFGKAGHNLDAVVRAAGSRDAAYAAMQRGVQSALDAGKLATSSRGVFQTVVRVEGVDVTVRGAVVDGVAKIGSAWR